MSNSSYSDPAERSKGMRLLYRNWRPTRLGLLVNSFWAWWSGLGLPPKLQAALEVKGRKSGLIRTSPVVLVPVEEKQYIVSMLGSDSDWVKNIEAAHGEAVIRQGRRRHVHLILVPPELRATILREHVRIAPGGRRHFPVLVGASLSEFAAIAGRYPVYRIEFDSTG